MNQAEHDLLVIEAQEGSPAALQTLVRLHHRDLLRFAMSLGHDATLGRLRHVADFAVLAPRKRTVAI